MSRQSIVAPIGLITQPAKYGQYKRGALSTATNVVMRSPGIVSSMPGVTLYASGNTINGYAARLSIAGASSLLYYFDDGVSSRALQWVTSGSATIVNLTPSGWSGYGIAGRVRMATQRSRFFLTSWNTTLNATFRGVLAFDSEGSTAPRMAGLSQPSALVINSSTTTNAQAMAADTGAAWKAVIRRTGADGYDLVSAPSNAFRGFAVAGLDPSLVVEFCANHNYVAGDIVELYRTATVTPADTDPGATMYLAASQVITSTDIVNGFALVRDSCPDDALGVELYTNSGQEGGDAANLDPPASSDMCSFKGHMFYAATALPAQAKVGPRIAYGQLLTDADRTYGIGIRNTTGTFTSGSNVITAVVNMRGIAIGQFIVAASLSGGAGTITGVTATTITCSVNATSTGAASLGTLDAFAYAVTGLVGEAPVYLGDNDSFKDFNGYVILSGDIVPRTGIDTFLIEAERGVELILRVQRVYAAGTLTVRATNGVNYAPPLPEITATANTYTPDVKENRVAWSKFQQPEHVPPLNFSFVGSGTLYRMIPTRDALWLFCSDGLYRLSGDGGDGEGAWRIDLADPNLILAARNAAASLKDTVWAYTQRGLVAISDEGGIQEISLGVIGDLIVGANFSDTWDTFISVDQLHQEVWLTFRASPSNSTTYIFNTVTKTFVKFSNADYSAMEYAPYLQSLVLGKFTSGASPELYTFNADTSSSRMAGADVRFQPLFVEDPFDLKQFQDVTYIFDGVNASATITPFFSDTASTAFAVNQSSGESRATAGVPRRCAIAPSLSPGFQMSNVAAPWSFRGLSARYTQGGEETERD